MFGKSKKYDRLYGAWEERGVIGTRIEIDKNSVVVLWRGAPVLETGYSVKENEDGSLSLILKKTGMRYEGAASDYASVAQITEKEARLFFAEDFPITGRSEVSLQKTANNRYGNYDVVTDAFLDRLSGEWKDEKGYFTLSFRKDTVTVSRVTRRFVVLKSRYDPSNYIIHDENPSFDYIEGLANIEIVGDTICAVIPVCDAPSVQITFKKV